MASDAGNAGHIVYASIRSPGSRRLLQIVRPPAGPDDVHPAHGLQPRHFSHRHAGSAPFQVDVVHGSLHHDAHSPLAGARTEGWVDGMEVIGRITPADGWEEAKFHDTL